jgi:toxin ParE1/3/4
MTGYKLQPEAENDLEAIWHHTAKKWGVEQAMQYVDAFDEAFQFLADNPLAARERTEFTPTVRIHSFQKHLIVYMSDGTVVLSLPVSSQPRRNPNTQTPSHSFC